MAKNVIMGSVVIGLFLYIVYKLLSEGTICPKASIQAVLFGPTEDDSLVPISEVLRGPMAQDDLRLINYIRSNPRYLSLPSGEPYNLTHVGAYADPSMGQSTIVKKIFKNMKKGFFVECGALDGETRSNTLDLELNFGWQGLLIEGDPSNFDLVVQKQRKAWLSNTCLATKPYPHEVFFKQQFNVGKISGDTFQDGQEGEAGIGEVRVQCFPLYSLLAVMNVKVVDYFSLDVEGHEFEVLQTIPFDKVRISVLSVEYIHDKGGADEIVKFMESKGYRVVASVTNVNNLANDIIFAHESVVIADSIPSIRT